jgi:ABC-type multidrug transport system permease subunit
MLYSIAGDSYEAQPVILILAFIALLISGMLLPYSHMPHAVLVVGRVLPVTYMRDCFEWIFYKNSACMTGGLILVPVMIVEQTLGVLWNRR